jgi:hypothetical protein
MYVAGFLILEVRTNNSRRPPPAPSTPHPSDHLPFYRAARVYLSSTSVIVFLSHSASSSTFSAVQSSSKYIISCVFCSNIFLLFPRVSSSISSIFQQVFIWVVYSFFLFFFLPLVSSFWFSFSDSSCVSHEIALWSDLVWCSSSFSINPLFIVGPAESVRSIIDGCWLSLPC